MTIHWFDFSRAWFSLALSITMLALLCISGTQSAGAGRKTTRDTSQSALIMHPRAQLTGHKRRVNVLAFSPDAQLIASGSEDGAARIWDTATGQLKATLPGHKDVSILTFSPDGRTVAIGGYRKTVKLWDVQTATVKAALAGKEGFINSVAFSPDSRTLATASLYESIVRIWNVETGALEATLAHEKECEYGETVVWSVAFSPDGRTIATATSCRQVYLWDAETKKIRMTLIDPRLSQTVSVRSQGHWVDQIQTASHASKVYAVAFSPDGHTLATAGAEGSAKLWDMPTGKLKFTLEPAEKAYPLAFAPDAKILATSGGSTVRLWDARTGALLAKLQHRGTSWSHSFSLDGKLILTGSDNEKFAKLWDTSTGRLVAQLVGGDPPVAFSPDGRTLATAGEKGAVLLWDLPAR